MVFVGCETIGQSGITYCSSLLPPCRAPSFAKADSLPPRLAYLTAPCCGGLSSFLSLTSLSLLLLLSPSPLLPQQRLGYHGGMAEIMRHPFFSEQCRIDFTRLQPPAEGAGGAAQGKPEPLRTGVYWPTGGYQTTLSTLGLQKKTRSGTVNKLRKKLQTLQRNNAIVATDASSSGGGGGGGGGGRIRRRRSSTTIMVKS